MARKKTLKGDFYLLIIKVFSFTLISTIITYLFLLFFISITTSNNMAKTADHYTQHLDSIQSIINKNVHEILKGEVINLSKYNDDIKGEVVDLDGNHLFGSTDILIKNIGLIKSLNRDIVKNGYVYRLIGLKDESYIKGIYILRAPFGFSVNNLNSNPHIVLIYYLLILSPIVYFIVYIILFTTRLYKSVSKNINLLLEASEKISDLDFDFELEGVKGEEFIRIEKSFNIMNATIRKTVSDLSKLEQDRKLIVSSIAHDIRTPLTVIGGQIDLINECKHIDGFSLDSSLNIITSNCKNIAMHVENLSLLYKVSNSTFIFRIEPINLTKMLDQKLMEYKSISNNNINISFDITLTKENYLLDAFMLKRVLDNIFYNSLRYTKSGEIKISVSDNSTTGLINFICSDTGCGFKEQSIPHLFESYYHDESYSNHLGLGLFICKNIVTNYNGEIVAYNNSNGGATIEFNIREFNNDIVK